MISPKSSGCSATFKRGLCRPSTVSIPSAFNTVNTVNTVNPVPKPDAARRRSGTRSKARERRMIELGPSEHLPRVQWIQPTDNGLPVVWLFRPARSRCGRVLSTPAARAQRLTHRRSATSFTARKAASMVDDFSEIIWLFGCSAARLKPHPSPLTPHPSPLTPHPLSLLACSPPPTKTS
jgi:hypothetical protein